MAVVRVAVVVLGSRFVVRVAVVVLNTVVAVVVFSAVVAVVVLVAVIHASPRRSAVVGGLPGTVRR
ncbi:hypothetical protein [Streptomyces monomycini]|uniref:hypothetical protein n=1 Tax=Streptomyces monomycini TaxID=371720 RepID=UPI000AD30DAA|nr:hypothetical protein [Streptomyces monomycini]